jgi:hypothetical protein
MDFTIDIYKKLILALKKEGYNFQTFAEFMKAPMDKSVILRHDVDKRPKNSALFAHIQKEFNIKGTYYFRCVPESYDEQIIRTISKMNHEIGYHYEEMDLCNGDIHAAIKLFEKNLKTLRNICPIETICMHGSPRSKYDNKSIWSNNKYTDYEIIGEPYFDLNFNKVGYLTDTGRTWDGARFSVRDKVVTNISLNVKSTQELILNLHKNSLPKQLMLTFHPQRWTSNFAFWTQELILQNLKNIVKRYIVGKS